MPRAPRPRRWRALGAAAGFVGPLWIAQQRSRYRRQARALELHERDAMSAHYAPATLDRVRLAVVPRIRITTPLLLLPWIGIRGPVVVASPAGMAFVDTIAVAADAWEDSERRRRSLLFHELVHVIQYDALGVRRFVSEYIAGWAAAGCDYFRIPLEEQAYDLQGRFERGEVFSVAEEVSRSGA